MHEWKLRIGDPIALTLASDARLGATDYCDDQIWELAIGHGDPPALSLITTYGLRFRSARIFPRFSMKQMEATDPSKFNKPPEIHAIYPNFILLDFSPFPDIHVFWEIWVPHSHAIVGRMSVVNKTPNDQKLRLEMVAQLSPVEGQRMAPFEMSAATVLTGYSGGISPVLFVTGGAKAGTGPYPSLYSNLHLEAGQTRQITWVQAALADRDTSFSMARELAVQNLDAIRSRIEMLNAGNVEIFTGDANWDAAFMLAQKQALSLLVGPTQQLPHTSFVLTRQPDQGFSLRGDGSDYSHLWNGQPLLDAYYLASILIPIAPDMVEGVIRNYLATQAEDGAIDWKPGLAGQRGRLLAPPLLASLVWRLFTHTEDETFLQESFESLLHFVKTWFAPERDRDSDGIPEWDHPLQIGLDYHPVYTRWQSASLGVDISTVESPSLCGLLYKECQSLICIANQLQRATEIEEIGELAQTLKEKIQATWEEEEACYFDMDRDTHQSCLGELILEGKGSGVFPIRRHFEKPVRLIIQIRTDETIRRRPVLFLHGNNMSGNARVERINDEQFRWTPGLGQLTGKFVYSILERLEVRGLEPEDQVIIRSVNHRTYDLTLLAPLWAGIPEPEQARKLIDSIVTNPGLFWRSFGLPACPRPPEEVDQNACWSINLPWNMLIAEGLIRYGFRDQAAELVSRQMSALIQSLKKDNSFRQSYHANSGEGLGENNALSGLAPIGLFLEALGVRLISPQCVALVGNNPFPWPVTVKYRGLTILKQKEKTTLIFPDSQTVTVTDPEPHLVSIKTG